MTVPKAQASNVRAQPFNSTACLVTWDPVEDTIESVYGKLGGYRVILCFRLQLKEPKFVVGQQILATKARALRYITVADPGFPVGGGVHPLGGRGPPTWALAVKMYVKMKDLGPIGGRARGTPLPRSANATMSKTLFILCGCDCESDNTNN